MDLFDGSNNNKKMTTIICAKCKEGFILVSDMQVGTGHLRLPLHYSKIRNVENRILIGGAGSVAETQQLSNKVLRQQRVDKAMGDISHTPINPDNFINSFCETLFNLNLQYRKACFSEFLVCGFDEDENIFCSNISGDGARIDIPSFYAIGSGSELALGTLAKNWRENLTKKETIELCLEAMGTANGLDVYTGLDVEAWLVTPTQLEIFQQEPVKESKDTNPKRIGCEG